MTTNQSEQPWIEHTGGECPVAPETMVDVRYRLDGRSIKGDRIKAHYLRWRHNKSETRSGGGDIIAYRIVSPAPSTPQAQDVGELVVDLLSIDFTEAAAALQSLSATVVTLTAELDDYKLSALLASDPREAFRQDLVDLRATVAAQAEEIERLTRENNRYSYERDKAREERDAAERRSEAFWKPQASTGGCPVHAVLRAGEK